VRLEIQRDILVNTHDGTPEGAGFSACTGGSAPSVRESMGFAVTPGGMLYVFGGLGYNGKEGG
jgi:hypothetical protein